jgi:hypothetical protein
MTNPVYQTDVPVDKSVARARHIFRFGNADEVRACKLSLEWLIWIGTDLFRRDPSDPISEEVEGEIVIDDDSNRWKKVPLGGGGSGAEGINPGQFGAVGDGETDDAAAFQAMFDFCEAEGIKEVSIPGDGKVYLLESEVTAPPIRMKGVGWPKIKGTNEFEGAIIRMVGGALSEDETTLVIAAAEGALEITVADAEAAGIEAGKWIRLESDTEYFNGITGVSGFQPVTKSELTLVQSVAGDVITLERALKHSYSVTGPVVTVQIVELGDGAHVEGIIIEGGGEGSDNASAAVGPKGIQFDYCLAPSLVGNRFRNNNAGAALFNYAANGRSYGNLVVGRVGEDPTNLPNVSPFFYGIVVWNSAGFIGSHDTGYNLRRLYDVNAVGQEGPGVIATDVVLTNFNVFSSFNGAGTHHCKDVVIANFRIDAFGGVYFRGKNLTIANGRIRYTDPNTSSAGILIGGDDGTNYSEDPSCGNIDIANIDIDGLAHTVLCRVDCDSFRMRGVRHRNCANNNVHFTGKRIKNVMIEGCDLEPGNYASGTRYVVWVENVASRLLELDSFIVRNNTLRPRSRGVGIDAPPVTAPAKNIRIDDNRFLAHVSGTAAGDHIRMISGYFGANVGGRGNHFIPTSTPGNEISLAAGVDHFLQYPDFGANHFDTNPNRVIAYRGDTSLASKSTVLVGDKILNSTPASSTRQGWVCTVAGTTGTLSGITGSIDIGVNPNLLVVSSAADITPGMFLNITGAGAAAATLKSRVSAVSGNNVTLATAASTTISGQAVAYAAPTFVSFGLEGGGAGDVTGPGSAVVGNLPTFSNTDGDELADSGIAVTDLAPKASPALTGNPTAPTQSAGDNSTKIATTAYADNAVAAAAANLGKRPRVRAATTGNITISTALNSGDTLDGVTLANGDLVLIKNQSSPEENGIYVVGTTPARSPEFDTYNEHPGSLVSVAEGTANADTLWLCSSNEGGTLGSSALAFTQLLVVVPASESVSGISQWASAAAWRANTADRVLVTDRVWSAAAIVALSDGATIAVDMSAGFNFSVTLGGNRTLGNPTNPKVGQSGAIVVTQDGAGSRTLAYDTNWEFSGGSAPVLSTAIGAKDILFYWVQSSTSIIVTGMLKGVQ